MVKNRVVEDRIFVREVAGKYDELVKTLATEPRVFHTREIATTGGPVFFGKDLMSPGKNSTQAFHVHTITLAPGGRSQKHAHMNSAVLYYLEGTGYEIHDGERFDWRAGDVAIVRNGCVHQHFNTDPDKPARILIFKSKPLFLFLRMLFQKGIEKPPDKASPGWENWEPDEVENAPDYKP